MDSTVWIPLLLGSSVMTFLGAVFTAVYTRKNMRADTAQKISEANGTILAQFQEANNELRARQARTERIQRVQRVVIDAMFVDLVRLGLDNFEVEKYRLRLEKAEEYTAAEMAALPEAGGR